MINAPANLSEDDAVEWHERFVGPIPNHEPVAETASEPPILPTDRMHEIQCAVLLNRRSKIVCLKGRPIASAFWTPIHGAPTDFWSTHQP